jgi:N-acetylglucosaminyl-diphospho-decaprenol L-rhamnosyltransferase
MRSPTLSASTVDIVVVTWNSAHTLDRCLTSLRQYRPPASRLAIIDNASRDSTLDILHAHRDEISKLIENRTNRGFAAACNQGARSGESSAILFLNPDCEIQADSIPALLSALASDPRNAAAGGKLVGLGETPQSGFAIRSLPRAVDLCLESLLVNRVFPGNAWNKHYRRPDFAFDEDAEVEQPAGACFMIRRALFQEMGGFDEQFHPAWFEDVDLCRRLRSRGARIVYCAGATIIHAGGSSIQSMPAGQASEYFFLNMLRYSRKHLGGAKTIVLRMCLALGMIMRILVLSVGHSVGYGPANPARPDRQDRGALRRAYWNVMKGAIWQRRP